MLTLAEAVDFAENGDYPGPRACPKAVTWAHCVLSYGSGWKDFNRHKIAHCWRLWLAERLPVEKLDVLVNDPDWLVRCTVAERIAQKGA